MAGSSARSFTPSQRAIRFSPAPPQGEAGKLPDQARASGPLSRGHSLKHARPLKADASAVTGRAFDQAPPARVAEAADHAGEALGITGNGSGIEAAAVVANDDEDAGGRGGDVQ